MARNILVKGIKGACVASALLASLLMITSCAETAVADDPVDNSTNTIPTTDGPVVDDGNDAPEPIVDDPVPPVAGWNTIELMVRTDPADPHNERFLEDWRLQAFAIDDQARPLSSIYYGTSDAAGNALLGLPSYMFSLPLVINAYNDAYPLADTDGDTVDECRSFEIFIPANCYDKAIWLIGPVEDALWTFYKMAAMKRGEAWNPSQVDCATWLANLQLLISTDEVEDELEEISDTETMLFDAAALTEALQENQQVLVPTRPPICMAERRHNGGGLERGDVIAGGAFPYSLDDTEAVPDVDPIVIGANGIVDSICGCALDGEANVNATVIAPDAHFIFDEDDFQGTVHDEEDPVANMDVAIFNVRHSNGREGDHDKHDDACSLTTLIEFTNKDDDEQDVLDGSGVTFTNLFDAGDDTGIFLTSDGDAVLDDNDYWAIFYDTDSVAMEEKVITVELLGHRQEDFRDVLHMQLTGVNDEDLFIGVRADYELNEEEVDGERAFLGFTITTWDGTDADGRSAIRENIANCYEASDVWARQFFITKDFQVREDEWCVTDECEIASLIKPLVAAEYAVRSQCFSNSRANQRWQTDDVGFWMMNTHHGVHPNVVINAGWLAPDLDYELYIQKFDEAVFKGPRTIRRTDACGQMMAAIPTLVEGDRILIRAEDSCCDDYEIVLPCVPEFTGFAGVPGVPYVPQTLGPPPPPPVN